MTERLLTMILDIKYRKAIINNKPTKLLFVQKCDFKVNLDDGYNEAKYANFNLSNVYWEMVDGQIDHGDVLELIGEDKD